MQPNSKLLVLGGVHGWTCGRVEKKDFDEAQMCQNIVHFMMNEKGKTTPGFWDDWPAFQMGEDGKLGDSVFPHLEDIQKRGMQVVFEPISDHMNKKFLDEQDDVMHIIEAIKKHNPTVISLAWCYTKVSQLYDTLILAGIYAFLLLDQDSRAITKGKVLQCDEGQKQFIEKLVKEKPQNLFLWGGPGTGKTLLA